jgi:predicted translin family RNA/ssDNA-binding protein
MTDQTTIESGSVDFLAKNDFANVVGSRETIRAEIKDLEKQLKSHNEEIEAMMVAAGVQDQSIALPYYTVKIVKSFNSRIDSKKLLEHGVEPGVIVAATVKKDYSYVKVQVSK